MSKRKTIQHDGTILTRLVVELPENLKNQFKGYCANKGNTMRDEVLVMVRQVLELSKGEIKE